MDNLTVTLSHFNGLAVIYDAQVEHFSSTFFTPKQTLPPAARNAALASSRLPGHAGVWPAGDLRPRALLRPLQRGRLAGWPNVRLPMPIAAFRAQGRFSQLSARSCREQVQQHA
jgi:hypothetical protein